MGGQYKVIGGAAVVKFTEAGEQMLLHGRVFNGSDYDVKSVERLLDTGLVAVVAAASKPEPVKAPAKPKN